MSWKDLQPEQGAKPAPAEADEPLSVDPGHVRTLAHYGAMLDELLAQK